MREQSVLWVALALLAPAVAGRLWPPLRRRVSNWEPYLHSFAPWLHGVGPAYLALITGAIPARYFGLAAQSALAWAGGLLFCTAWLVVTARYQHPGGRWPKPARGVLAEPGWALYRAAGTAWIGSPPLGALIGLVLAAAELGLGWLARADEERLPWESLARTAGSTVLFVVTGSFWLTLVTQGVALYLLRGRRL